ncbi:MAG: FtsX-like permease family protein [Muribaculaceae bacterium]|nr:FtsX-like permease family protein [Roseburia sp.]MCM1430309.1 FtsX-like permease family protein [Muribaculaceae bacterium]MCM1492495.1 FtsX-like permease family protein [Muribaculaceae bacterium]
MKMTTKVALDNMKYYKSKNILTGIAIVLTTLLLFVVPTVGKGILDMHFAFINTYYPSMHALYRNVDMDTVQKLAAHHDITEYGLRADVGEARSENATAYLYYIDEEGMKLYNQKLMEGRLPETAGEIVVSKDMLLSFRASGDIGDTITIPCQIYRNGALDYAEDQEFVICGFLTESAAEKEKNYSAFVSYAFLENEIPAEEISCRFLFRVYTGSPVNNGELMTAEIREKIKNIAEQFGIAETDTAINEDYLMANYVDPVILPTIIAIMLIIMLAGMVTIYSIYYVSMHQRLMGFGRLKAIGATKRQLRQIVLKEGLGVAAIAIPAGLVSGSLAAYGVMLVFLKFTGGYEGMTVHLYHWWIYLLAAAATILSVYFSLRRPMRLAARASAVEVMRGQTGKRARAFRKGYENLTIGKLTARNIAGDRKRSAATILSMSLTGMLLMVVASVLSCASPVQSADSSIVGQYMISPIIENNQEHPERKWSEVQKNHPLDVALMQQLGELPGVERVEAFTSVAVTGGPLDADDQNGICGVPESFAEEVEADIIEGSATYEDLMSGDKVIVDNGLLYWYPEISVGDSYVFTIHDGDDSYEKELEVIAIADYRYGLTNYDYLVMAKSAADALCRNNSTGAYHVFATTDYDEELANTLTDLVEESGRLLINTWKTEYETWKQAISMTSSACYVFLGILAVISVMNLVNTMINSVHVRKKELGMLQATGMSDRQLLRMLRQEGLFYILGTLVISVGLGSLLGYPVFLYAKASGFFEIRSYHYPWEASLIVTAVLLLLQMLLASFLARSVRKDSLIDRIRFSE